MRKRIVVLICFVMALVVGVPVVSNTAHLLNAAEGDDGKEKIIDFELGSLTRNNTIFSMYIISERNHLYFNPAFNNEYDITIMMDSAGKPLEKVIKVSGSSSSGNGSMPKGSGMALRSDNTLYVWGYNDYGQFGNGTVSSEYFAQAIIVDPGIPNIVSVLSTERTNYILTANGDVYASGDNTNGQFGNGTTNSSTTFTKVDIRDVKKLTRTEPNIIYALKNDGTIYSWGGMVYDGINTLHDVTKPTPIYAENRTDFFTNVVDIDAIGSVYGNPSVAVLVQEDITAKGYIVGRQKKGLTLSTTLNTTVSGLYEVSDICFGYTGVASGSSSNPTNVADVSFIGDGKVYSQGSELAYYFKEDGKILKLQKMADFHIVLTEKGRVFLGSEIGSEKIIKIPLKINAVKTNDTAYQNEEKYHDNVELSVVSTSIDTVTCQVEDTVGNTASICDGFADNKINVAVHNQRVYRKYIFSNDIMSQEIIVDLYKGTPILSGYSTTVTNKIKIQDSISLAVPSEQSGWNSYSATITDATGNTSDFTGGTLSEGTYTLHLSDAYGNTQDYKFEVTDKPAPTAVFTPSITDFVYNDTYTKVNGTIGTISLQYPAGEPTSNIASIQLGNGSDDAKFSIDTNGTLKVKGSNLNAGTYNITVSGKDGNQMDFTKAITIVVGKANQDNYQITNNANYPFHANQEIAITTSGNDSGENETYTITGGNSVAQIAGSNKFKILTSGTFTLEATVAGNTNYNPKTVSKTITISELPMQNPAIKISSSDSMMYGDTYTPTSSGGQGSGSVTWSIENDNGTGAVLSSGTVKVSGVGSFTLKVTKAGDSSVQSSSDTKVITVNRRRTTVKPKNVTKLTGEVFKDNGVTYNPQPISGDNLGTPIITSKYPIDQGVGYYNDGIQVNGLSHPNYEFIYEEGTLIINSNSLPNNGNGYYKVEGTKGKNNWYVSDVRISTTGKDGYDQISADGISFQTQPLTYHSDGDYSVEFYLKNSTTGIIAKAIRYQLKIDQTSPTVPTLTMKEINTSAFATFINTLSFGNWMKQGAEVTMLSSDETSGIDNYVYSETSKGGTTNKTSLSGIVTYQNDVELTIKAKACDKAGNCSEESNDEALMIDRKAPTISGVKDQGVYKYYYLPRFVTIKDEGSGLSYGEYTRDGVVAGTFQADVSERIEGVGTYTIKAIDNAGNEGTLTFQIVPLPDIDDIDGSDESKEIIDQVQKEYEEIKNKIDETEKKDIEDWIHDALEKWNSSRKKVVETDDKSAKVEGQGDTSFDPKVELIVDEISENDVPKLPKKAIVVYDVYLRKGTTKIQPDGSIKVYLPYVEETTTLGDAMGGARTDAEPIVYQIDTNNKVTQIRVQREGDFVTFITDKLVKYAISNEAQKDNENNNCVVGKDETINTGDDVCGLPNDKGDQPEKQPDGSVKVPEGGKVEFPNGTDLETPDGATILPDGTVILPDGTQYDPNGNKKDDDKDKQCPLEGKDINVDTDGDGKPDLNIDLDKDCIADLNIDTNFDNIPDIDIDTKGDGKADINIDTDHDGKANINIAIIKRWIPNKDCVYNGFAYDTGEGFTPYLNIDDDGDGKPDRNIDDDGDGIPDRNIDQDWFDKYGDLVNSNNPNTNIGGANTGDNTKWTIWWFLLILTGCTLSYSQYRKRKQS